MAFPPLSVTAKLVLASGLISLPPLIEALVVWRNIAAMETGCTGWCNG